jgi:hypothetical protein
MPLATPLYQAFFENPKGLCGRRDDALIIEKIASQETRLHLITLAAVADNSPNPERWGELLKLETHWLLDSSQVAYKQSKEIAQAFRSEQIRVPQHIARVWWQICRGIKGRFDGSLRAFFSENGDDTLSVKRYFQRSRTAFPILSAETTSARWLDLIHRHGSIELKNWEQLRIPLGERESAAAKLFDLDEKQLHPSLALALQTWTYACHRLDAESCALPFCPHRKK